MLQFLRNNTKIIVWFAVFLMIGVFGLSSISLHRNEQYAGEVFGKKISFQEFRAFETITRLLPPSQKIVEDPKLESQFTWQQIILSHEAKNKKIEVSDKEVQARVDQLVNPDEAHRLSSSEYQNLLRSRRTTPNEFENGVREMIRIQKMVASHFENATSPSSAADGNTDAKDAEKKAAAEIKQKQEAYVRWMTDIFQRAKAADYSKLSQTTSSN